MSIGSKPADKLAQSHCHSLHMQDNSKELQDMIQQGEGEQPLASKHMEMVGSCCHKQMVEKDMLVPR